MFDTDQYVQIARVEYPEGRYCGECGLVNFWADDCGWFCGNNKHGKYVPLCEECWNKHGYRTTER